MDKSNITYKVFCKGRNLKSSSTTWKLKASTWQISLPLTSRPANENGPEVQQTGDLVSAHFDHKHWLDFNHITFSAHLSTDFLLIFLQWYQETLQAGHRRQINNTDITDWSLITFKCECVCSDCLLPCGPLDLGSFSLNSYFRAGVSNSFYMVGQMQPTLIVSGPDQWNIFNSFLHDERKGPVTKRQICNRIISLFST